MSESILVADDSLLVRESVEAALRGRGSRVELASDGAQARSLLREIEPDLLIADVHMPGLDGYALCREAKSERAQTRVLLLVGTFEPFDSSAASGARADGVLRKPFVADELLRKIEDLLGPVAAGPAERRRAEPESVPLDARAAAAAAAVAAAPTPPGADQAERLELDDAAVERIARRVLELGGAAVLERVARELLGEAAIERVRGAARSSDLDTEAGRSTDDRRGDPERE